ncbi:MAG: DUF2782 domain-containing protein [Gammaproteobacteria bacterium]|nr:DUF2782 domain-containing protein [Gammaproteobacteria bacterium]
MKTIIAYSFLVFFSASAFAQSEREKFDENFESEVRIVDTAPGLIEEYSSNGQVFMIKITPKKGRPYYLVDADGDGNLESHRNDNAPRLLIPSWVIFSW